jgi:hypothetical protein
MIINGDVIGPWQFGCWDEDGWQVECDLPAGAKPQLVSGGCAYHKQWMRIGGENAMIAWVEPAEGDPGAFECYAWDPAAEDHVELCTKIGDHYIDPHDAMRAADEALVNFIETYRRAS